MSRYGGLAFNQALAAAAVGGFAPSGVCPIVGSWMLPLAAAGGAIVDVCALSGIGGTGMPAFNTPIQITAVIWIGVLNAGIPVPPMPDKAQTSTIAPPAAARGNIHEPTIGQTPEGANPPTAAAAKAWLNARPPYLDISGSNKDWNTAL